MPFVYHDSRAVRCGRYLWRGRDCRSGEQMADSEALVLRSFATQTLCGSQIYTLDTGVVQLRISVNSISNASSMTFKEAASVRRPS